MFVGSCLILIDWVVFVMLSSLGMAPWSANLAGRAAGAIVGFWANGKVTFAESGYSRLGRRRFLRYIVLWSMMTILSTLFVTDLVDYISLEFAWLAKPLVEASLAITSFFISRHWVYR